MKTRILLSLLVVVMSSSLEAGVYKCVLDGKTTYSQKPCEGEMSEVVIKAAPSPAGNARDAEDYKKSNKELDAAINERRGQRKLRGLKQELVILKNKRDREMAHYRSLMRRAATKADVMIIQQEIANRRSEYAEAIRSKEDEIRNASASIGPGGH